jgi:hypothetical protein
MAFACSRKEINQHPRGTCKSVQCTSGRWDLGFILEFSYILGPIWTANLAGRAALSAGSL